jgi:hypothetical protein
MKKIVWSNEFDRQSFGTPNNAQVCFDRMNFFSSQKPKRNMHLSKRYAECFVQKKIIVEIVPKIEIIKKHSAREVTLLNYHVITATTTGQRYLFLSFTFFLKSHLMN